MRRLLLAMTLGSLLLAGREAAATPPTLFSQPAYQSPVRADPGDLLLIAGNGFAATDTVVYVSLTDTTLALTHPTSVPTTSTATTGVAPVVNTANTPDSLVVSLPPVMTAKQSYALWVRNSSGEWSNGVRINDARPLWISPDRVYVSALVATLPRYLKVVGRNLQAKTGSTTQVKLTGPTTYTLTTADDGDPTTAIENYAASVSLPTTLIAGTYNVSVSRDGVSWVPLSGQNLTVAANPSTGSPFAVSSYGCLPTDAVDDTSCVLSAITAAKNAGGGTVTFASGTWIINNPGAAGVAAEGIVVPPNVNLVGAGLGFSIVERGASWTKPALFALQGPNVIQGFTFKDLAIYTPSSAQTMMLMLGVAWRNAGSGPTQVSNVTITQNRFDRPYFGITAGGLPMDHIYITNNEFGAYYDGLNLSGDFGNFGMKFHMDDSIVAFNTFAPGSFTAPIAAEMGPANRVDFSNNTADGAAINNRYLYAPGTDPTGFRAGFFWSMNGNIQNMLMSQNTINCPGDRYGDGEGIAYDGNHNVAALPAAQFATAATATTVTVAGPLLSQIGTNTLPADYFSEHWVTVADGPGRGQLRKIVSYTVGASGTPVTFTVSPAWDVAPQTTSRILVEREYWQVYTVDNHVDQRTPLCTKGNTKDPVGGLISPVGPTADSTVEGNQQYDTGGITLYSQYTVTDPAIGSGTAYSFQDFIDVRNNVVDGEYNWDSSCSWSGIWLAYQAGNTAGSSPPTESYGVSIAHNKVNHADALHGGGLGIALGWLAGPSGTNWDLAESVLMFGNSISNVNGAAAGTAAPHHCNVTFNPRVGINIDDSHVFHTILASNSCTSVSPLLHDGGTATQKICAAIDNPCECPTGLVGYWRLDEGSGTTTADSSGGSNNGALVGGPVWTSGKTGGALNFAAAASYLSISNTAALNDLYASGQGMTVTAWINPASAGGGGGGRIIDKDNSSGGWFLKMNTAGTSVQFAADQFATAATRNSAANSIALNKWQHVAVTWTGSPDATKINIYINGGLANDSATPTSGTGAAESDAGTPFTIGNRTRDKARNFNGSIDGVRVYNRVLAPEEIQSLVNGGS